MSKALVIKGASFYQNRLDVITLDDTIPCTGIVLSDSTMSMTNVGSSAALTATVAPANTTDTLFWTSSDSNIVRVTDGVLYQAGVGTATITAMCGAYSAVCTVTATMVYEESDLERCNGGGIIANPSGSYDSMKWATNNTYLALSLASNATGGYQAIVNSSELGKTVYPIPVPYGASYLDVVFPSNVIGWEYVHFADSKTKQTSVENVDASKRVYSITVEDLSGSTHHKYDLSAVSGYTFDSICISLRGVSGSASEYGSPISVVFS